MLVVTVLESGCDQVPLNVGCHVLEGGCDQGPLNVGCHRA